MDNEQTDMEPSEMDAAVEVTEESPQEASPEAEETWQPKDWFNVDEYPEDMRERMAPVITKMKSEWDTKSRKASDYEKQVTETQQTLTQLQQIAREVLTDTSNEALSKFRAQYGIQADPLPSKDTKDTRPTLDFDFALSSQENFKRAWSDYESNLAEYVDKVANSVADKVRRDTEVKYQHLAEPIHKAKWENAFKTLEDKYGDSFKEVQRDIVQKVSTGPYSRMYGAMKDTDLIEKAFIAEHPEAYHKYLLKQEAAKTELKKQAQTERGRKNLASKPVKSGDDSVDSIVARVTAQLGKEV